MTPRGAWGRKRGSYKKGWLNCDARAELQRSLYRKKDVSRKTISGDQKTQNAPRRFLWKKIKGTTSAKGKRAPELCYRTAKCGKRRRRLKLSERTGPR